MEGRSGRRGGAEAAPVQRSVYAPQQFLRIPCCSFAAVMNESSAFCPNTALLFYEDGIQIIEMGIGQIWEKPLRSRF